MSASTVTAAMLVIGDEILSGRTKDKNIGYVAEYLGAIGIELKEARVVGDDQDQIVAAVNALRTRYDYLFTSGGIGPTHDDITADCVAAAFGVAIDLDPRAVALLEARYQPGELNAARLRMARIPAGADLIDNPISRAPGFVLGNVIVMAGVPAIMQTMLDAVAPTLRSGAKMLTRTVEARGLPEGVYASDLAAIAKAAPGVSIGSYPSFTGTGFRNQIVVRARDEALLDRVSAEVEAMVGRLAPDQTPM